MTPIDQISADSLSAAIAAAFRCAREDMFFSAGYWVRVAVNAMERINDATVRERAALLTDATIKAICRMEGCRG